MARADGWVILPANAERASAGSDLAFLPR
jgi:hypothetical protein